MHFRQSTTVDDFVSVRASKNHKARRPSTGRLQQIQYQSLKNNKFQTEFNKVLNLVRDQVLYPALLVELL
jgi:hypothetical protein